MCIRDSLNIGAGRIVYQDLVKINRACADGSILKNKEIVSAFSYAKANGKNIHFMGPVSYTHLDVYKRQDSHWCK